MRTGRSPGAFARTLALSALAGCWYVDDAQYLREVQDYDQDGGIAERFGGPDCVDTDPSIPDCDADDDTFRTALAGGDDCDDHDATVVPGVPWFRDGDADGYGALDDATTGCGEPTPGWTLDATDCDDANAAIAPSALELCDDLDRNCDGDPTRGAEDAAVAVYADVDEDGYGDGTPFLVCAPGEGESTFGADCAPADGAVYPGAPEVPYDGIDQDCVPENEFDQDLDGVAFDAFVPDCDDQDPDTYPADGLGGLGAPEVCDGLDNDCDGLVDDEEADEDQAPGVQLLWYVDVDGDGFGGLTPALFCVGIDPGPGYGAQDDDCNDLLPSVFPGAVERCNAFDDDCNGAVDEGSAVDAFTAYLDQDGDGYGGEAVTTCALDADLDGDGDDERLSVLPGDCADTLPDAYPGATEICGDAVRQDCSDFDPDDCDNDGFTASAADPALRDCDDDPADGAVTSPGAAEACDGADNDCDDLVDSEDPDAESGIGIVWYRDADGDGQGSAVVLAMDTCDPPPTGVRAADDCDDTRPGVFVGAVELCDALDNDCDGVTDESAPDAPLVYFDADGDGSGSAASFQQACDAPPGWVGTADDCDDGDPARGPLLPELCSDGLDNDCDGLADDADPDAAALSGQIWYPDGDGDGLGSAPGLVGCDNPDPSLYVDNADDCDDSDPSQLAVGVWYDDLDGDGASGTLAVTFGCRPDAGWSAAAPDCNDYNAFIYPSAPEVCDGVDQDCDGLLDDDPAVAPLWYVDGDGDGDGGVGPAPVLACEAPPGSWALVAADCADADPARSSLALEDCDDGIDNDCDGLADLLDDDSGDVAWYVDADLDGYGAAFAFTQCADPGLGFAPTDDDCDDSPLTGGLEGPPDVWFSDEDGDGQAGTQQVVVGCQPEGAWFPSAADCVDSDSKVFAGAPEACNGRDDDCNGITDDDYAVDAVTTYEDVDGDGWGGVSLGSSCESGGVGVTTPGDCDDADGWAQPFGLEVCDRADNDCDGVVDDGACAGAPTAAPAPAACVGWQWPDEDGDGWGDSRGEGLFACGFASQEGYAPFVADCDDTPVVGTAAYPGIAGTFSTVTGADLLIDLQFAGCVHFLLADGATFVMPSAAVVPAGATLSFAASPGTGAPPVIVAPPGDAIVHLTNADSAVTFSGVHFEASPGSTARLFTVQEASSELVIRNGTLRGLGTAGGIDAIAGTVELRSVRFEDMAGTFGTALRKGPGGVLETGNVTVDRCTGASSVEIDTGNSPTVEGFTVLDSAPVDVVGAYLNGATLRDFDVRGALADGIVLSQLGLVTIERTVVADAAGDGIASVTGRKNTVRDSTLVGNGGYGVDCAGTGVLSGLIAIDNLGGDLSPCSSAEASYAPTSVIAVTDPLAGPPLFVTYDAGFPSVLWDLHLRDGSGDLILGPDDAGAYSRLEVFPPTGASWYDLGLDGLPDGWEWERLGAVDVGETANFDLDPLDLAGEFAFGTDPLLADTDGDGLTDYADVAPLDPSAP